MRYYLTEKQAQKLSQTIRRVDNLPINDASASSYTSPSIAPLRWFRLEAVLDGEHSHALATLAEWNPTASDPTWDGSHGAYQTTAKTVVVRGYGKHYGLIGEWGAGRLIVANEDRNPQLEVTINPGASRYWVYLPECTVSEEAVAVTIDTSTINAYFDTEQIPEGTPIVADRPAQVVYDPTLKRWMIDLPVAEPAKWFNITAVNHVTGEHTMREVVYYEGFLANGDTDVSGWEITGSVEGLPGVRVLATQMDRENPSTNEVEKRWMFRYPDGTMAKLTLVSGYIDTGVSLRDIQLINRDNTLGTAANRRVINRGNTIYAYDGQDVYCQWCNGQWVVMHQRMARAKWIRFSVSSDIYSYDTTFSDVVVQDWYEGPSPGASVTIANHGYNLFNGTYAWAIWDGVRNQYSLTWIEPREIQPVVDIGSADNWITQQVRRIYAVPITQDVEYPTQEVELPTP